MTTSSSYKSIYTARNSSILNVKNMISTPSEDNWKISLERRELKSHFRNSGRGCPTYPAIELTEISDGFYPEFCPVNNCARNILRPLTLN
jgi:hypothetical protein